MEARDGSGGSWGSSWRHLGPNTAETSKKLEKMSRSTPPWEPAGQPKLDQKVTWTHFFMFFGVCFFEICFFIDF